MKPRRMRQPHSFIKFYKLRHLFPIQAIHARDLRKHPCGARQQRRRPHGQPLCEQVSWENLLRSTRHEHSSTTLGRVYMTMDYGLFLIWVHGSPQKKGDSTWKNGTLSYQPNPDLSSMFSRHPRISAASQETFDSWKLPDLRACGGRLFGIHQSSPLSYNIRISLNIQCGEYCSIQKHFKLR